MTRALGQIDDATARALVLHFGLKGAIDYATSIFQMGGPLAKEYGWLADYLTTYKAATEVGQWPKVFGETAALRAYREGGCPGCSFRRQTGGNHDDVPTGDADPNCAYREATP